ncbi:MAG: peroxiredoxin [Methanolinea sp.]|jgi:peroxiredoxin Q/BCP|nr:peroxiredoxin [Methanolinea sp.]
MALQTSDPLLGQHAPPFCLPDSRAHEVCLSSYRGRWVVLYFYPRDNTPGCTLEALSFNNALESFAGLGAQVLGVSSDTPESHQRFADRNNLSILLLSDTSHRVLEAYHSWKPKKIFGKEVLGTQRDTFLIDPEGRVVDVWRKVSPKGHADEVKAALSARLAGT